jgi:glycosyltransferase involved in cell wall biosynthesis
MIREVDLVWGTSPPLFQGLSAWLLSRIKGAPFLMEVRDLWPYFAIETGVIRRPTLIRLSEALERFLYRHADALVVNSPGYVEHVQARGGERVQVIPNGVDTGMFMPTEGGDEFRRRHNLQGKFIAMYAGAHGLSNDLHVLLEAAGQLREHDHIAIVLVGDGKEKSALRASAEARGLTNVRFLSPLPKEEMPAALAAADLCIAILKPIRAYATTYPNKVFDYMAAARPVLLAIDGVIRELVESAGAGIYVPPGDPQAMAHAIITLEAAPGDRDRMGMQGRSYVESHFQRSALTLQLAALMQSLLRAGKDDPFAGGAP